ncbi:putative nuclease HARBI1 [Monomorium pharaonis]|uniref:putative nuclease HARBI1 n=1 Tax=Monomorium pharaonis TaxID=307658 RepID=UPI001746A4A5|nr:putative nuclease HARBI1 [Monomorium pharaonis]
MWKLMTYKEKVCRRIWVRPIFTERRRLLQDHSDNLVKEMELVDEEMFYNYCRMSVEIFNQLLNNVGPHIEKQYVIRDPIPARTRLLLCLRYLASGDAMASIAYSFRIGINTVSKIISETCEELWNTLHESVFLKINKNNWLTIANYFATKWDFPHCIGTIDGKQVQIQSPPHNGSVFYNYKGNHSINLLAVCDAKYCFTLVDIGAEGSDGGIFAHSNFGQQFDRNEMDLPQPRPIKASGLALPFVLVADEAFALTYYMMRPYPRLNRQRKVFNYRLSRARRMIESAFCILTSKWQIYRRPIIASVSTAVKIIQATVCLHNFIIQNENKLSLSKRHYIRMINKEVVNNALQEISNAGRNGHTRFASKIRDDFASYFENTGAIPWHWEKALLNDF